MVQIASRFNDGTAQSLRESSVRPSTWREEDRSFEVVWSTGAAVTRFDWFDGEFYDETLDLSPGAVRLDRLQGGGPVLVDHSPFTENLAGSIVPGSVRLEKGKAVARVRLADVPEIESIAAKIRDGHLKTVSVGYIVHQYTRKSQGKGMRDELRATDWEPTEISLTPVPADAGAVVRSRSTDMKTEVRDAAEDGKTTPVYRGGKPRRSRHVDEAQVLRACSRADLPRDVERELLRQHEEDPMNEQQLFDAVLDAVAERRKSDPINANNPAFAGDRAPTRVLFSQALLARMNGKPAPEEAREYVGASLVDMARHMLEERGEKVRWARPSAIIDMALRTGQHTTSDFADLLTDTSQRYLLEMFGENGSPLRTVARKRTLPDFRKMHGVRAGGDLNLLLTEENGEFKRGSMETTKNGIQLHTYGRIFALSRQAMINDDLGAFLDMQRIWSRAAMELEGGLLTGLISGVGPILEDDGKALYHADHGNLAPAGSAITVDSLSAGRQALRAQKDLDGTTVLNAVPKHLVVGPAKETEAEKVLAELSAATSDNVNPFSGKLELVVDPRITGNSWRLFADPNQFPVLEYAHLDGQESVFTDTRTGFDVDGVEFKARIDLGAAATDHRGTYLNPGD